MKPNRREFIEKIGAATAALTIVSNDIFSEENTSGSLNISGSFMQSPPDIISPEVLPDRKVIFRLFAPNAKEVILDGNYPIGDKYLRTSTTMNKDESGVWTATVGPMRTDFYNYYFIVNGIRVTDPLNSFVHGRSSVLRVNGPGLSDFEINDVPHGTLSAVWYPSPTFGVKRRMYVYTPPGYETSRIRYPVLYLLHGGSGSEESWVSVGKAPQILDNLIAQGKVKPMIVVMPNGNSTQVADSDIMLADSHPKSNVSDRPRVRLNFPKSFVKELIPFIDKTYRTNNDKGNRAIAGLSVGGAQTMYAAFNNPELFTYVGAFSGGYPAFPEWAIDIEPPINADKLRGPDIAKSIDPGKYLAMHPYLNSEINSKFKLLYITLGTEDGLISTHATLKSLLDRQGVKYTNVEVEGYGHEWSLWRLNLHDFLPKLF